MPMAHTLKSGGVPTTGRLELVLLLFSTSHV